MKTISFVVVATLLALITSCAKSTNPSPYFWTFKGATYQQNGLLTSSATLSAGSASPVSVVTVYFYHDSIPASNGTYTLVSNSTGLTPGQVWLTFHLGSTTYGYAGVSGQTIPVTVNSGQISALGSGLVMANTTNAADTAALSFDIDQLLQ